KQQKPINLTARSVEADLLRSGDKTDLDKLWTEGAVHVVQDPSSPEDKGVDIIGDTLQLNHFPDGNVLVVTGDLAKLLLDKLYIVGPEVHIDQPDNKAWVNGAGAMQMESTSSLSGNTLKKPVPIEIVWKESMFFQEQVAEFHGGVQAVQEKSRLLC